MKLLGWMHRKFRQNSSEPLKDFANGQPLLADQNYYPKHNYGTKPHKQYQRDHLRKSFGGLESVPDKEEDDYDAMSELFHGFLAIGTLGSDPNMNNHAPPTPTFAISVENITEKETEVTESELKLISDELEKVLAAEEGYNDSSARNSYVSTGRNSHVSTGRNSHVSTGRNSHVSTGRNSHVSTGRNSHVSNGRSSHGSTITLGGKSLEIPETNGNGSAVCPLQGYLFGSAVEMVETTTGAKKENRTSLGELFQKTKMGEELHGEKYDKEEKKDADKSAVNIMIKALKKKLLHASKRSYSAATERKLNKILQMFHRKVHPENTTSKQTKLPRNDKKTSPHDAEQVTGPYNITTFPKNVAPRKSMRRFSIDCMENREHWIKTDTDYLVLEL